MVGSLAQSLSEGCAESGVSASDVLCRNAVFGRGDLRRLKSKEVGCWGLGLNQNSVQVRAGML